jgi:hypothetical protein
LNTRKEHHVRHYEGRSIVHGGPGWRDSNDGFVEAVWERPQTSDIEWKYYQEMVQAQRMGSAFADGVIKQYNKYDETFRT